MKFKNNKITAILIAIISSSSHGFNNTNTELMYEKLNSQAEPRAKNYPILHQIAKHNSNINLNNFLGDQEESFIDEDQNIWSYQETDSTQECSIKNSFPNYKAALKNTANKYNIIIKTIQNCGKKNLSDKISIAELIYKQAKQQKNFYLEKILTTLGLVYFYDLNQTKKGIYYLKQASKFNSTHNSKYTPALYELGIIAYNGYYDKNENWIKSKYKAYEYFNKAFYGSRKQTTKEEATINRKSAIYLAKTMLELKKTSAYGLTGADHLIKLAAQDQFNNQAVNYYMGLLMFYGYKHAGKDQPTTYDIPVDHEAATKYFTQAALKEDDKSHHMLGVIAETNKEEPNYAEAEQHYLQAILLNQNLHSMFHLAKMYLEKHYNTDDLNEIIPKHLAINDMLETAGIEIPEANHVLGERLAFGYMTYLKENEQFVQPDIPQAIQFFSKAAFTGLIDSQYKLVKHFRDAKDYKNTYIWAKVLLDTNAKPRINNKYRAKLIYLNRTDLIENNMDNNNYLDITKQALESAKSKIFELEYDLDELNLTIDQINHKINLYKRNQNLIPTHQ